MNRLFALFLLLLAASPLAALDVLERHIDVRFRQTPLQEALATVAQKGGFEWSYNANLVDGKKPISLIANDWTVRETLLELLGDGYDFKANGNYLILKKRKKPTDQIYGYVKDPSTGQRVAHATVYDRRTLRATTTDSNGYYQLKVKKNTEIAVTRLDYGDTIFPVTSQSPRLQKIDLQVVTTPAPRGFNLEKAADIAASRVERFFNATLEKWNEANVQDSLHRRTQVSLLPKIGTNHNLSGKVVNDWSLNILVGSSLGNRRLEVGGIGNFTRKDVSGIQIGGIFNEVRGTTDGLQMAGIYNRSADTLVGVQVAGIINFSPRTADQSLQIAGLINISRSGSPILQMAGLVNVADSVEGLQIAGVVNRARRVKGLQIGLFNSARELHGFQIGLLNRSGRRVLPFFNW